jgi:methyl-accepting chemotaxis protein
MDVPDRLFKRSPTMTFKTKMWMLPIIAVLIVAAGIAINSQLTASTSDNLERLERVQYPTVEALRSMRSSVRSLREALQQAVAEGDGARLSSAEEDAAAFRSQLAALGSLGTAGSELARQIGSSFDDYHTAALQATKVLMGKAQGDAGSTISLMQSRSQALDARLSEAHETAIARLRELIATSSGSVKATLRVSLISVALMIAAMWIGSWFLIRSVFRNLGGEPEQAAAIVRRIAAGDFSVQVRIAPGDHGSLLHGIAELCSQLGGLIHNVHASSEQVDRAAQELDSTMNELSERTNNQAASLEQTASSMEQMLATVRQNADNAHHANELATAARSQAEAGGQVVNRAVQAVSAIHDSSRRIADIIVVIDEIAFQTNLLALNAAVEAARAGEQGRGFAVVATEVRNLAQRSATAAREIKELINDSVGKVKDGAQLVDESGNHLNDIVNAVKKVADIIGEIASASMEQTRGLDQVNRSMTQMDNMTQQNSAMTRETSAVARTMTQQAKHLTDLVSHFKVSEGGRVQQHAAEHVPAPARSAMRNAA